MLLLLGRISPVREGTEILLDHPRHAKVWPFVEYWFDPGNQSHIISHTGVKRFLITDWDNPAAVTLLFSLFSLMISLWSCSGWKRFLPWIAFPSSPSHCQKTDDGIQWNVVVWSERRKAGILSTGWGTHHHATTLKDILAIVCSSQLYFD